MIYIDVSAAVHSRAGLGRYSEMLASAILAGYPGKVALFYNRGREGKYPDSLPAGVSQRHVQLGYKPWRMAVLLAQMGHIPFNRLLPDVTLFHSTEHLLMPLEDCPTVLTVHDLIFKLFPDYHKKLNYWYLNKAMPIFCKKADAIIAVSQATKRDIVEYYQVDPAKIHVVYEAASSHFEPPSPARIELVREKYNLPSQFLIHLSTIEPRKNLSRLLDALLILRQSYPDLHLILVGGRGWLYEDFFRRIESAGLSQFVHALGWIPDADLPAVLAAADLAVQPSLYEGFGLPILEHMAVGQVVAASSSSSHPEIGGEAAAYFDPTSVTEMAVVIQRLLDDGDEYHHRRQLGLQQASQFSWQRAAKETTAVYESLLAQ